MIAGRRKELKMSQKDVAVRVKKEDGQEISVQYLNDVEHGRRRPPSDLMIRQIARILKFPLDALYFAAARFPRTSRSTKSSRKRPPPRTRHFAGN